MWPAKPTKMASVCERRDGSWLGIKLAFYPTAIDGVEGIQAGRGEYLGELRVLDLRGPWHDEVILGGSAKGDVVPSKVEQPDKRRGDRIDFIVGHATREVLAINARAVQPPLEF